MSNELNFLLRMRDEASAAIKQVSSALSGASTSASAFSGQAASANAALGNLAAGARSVATAVTEMYAATKLLRGVESDFMDYEKGMARIQSVSGMTGAQIEDFSKQFDKLNLSMQRIPRADLVEMIADLSQMGIANKDLASMAETIGKMSAATDLGASDVAQKTATILQLTGEGMTKAKAFGDALAYMDINANATSRQIFNMAMNVAQGTSQFNMSSKAILALATTAANLHIWPELMRSVPQRGLMELQQGAMNATAGFKNFLKVSQMTREEFNAMLQQHPEEVFLRLAEAYKKTVATGESGKFLKSLHLDTVQVNTVLGNLANNAQQARKYLADVNAGKQDGALDQRYATATSTQYDNMLRMSKLAQDLGKNLGEALAPLTRPVFGDVTTALEKADELLKEMPAGTRAWVAALVLLGPPILAARVLISNLKTMFETLNLANSLLKQEGGVTAAATEIGTAAGKAMAEAMQAAMPESGKLASPAVLPGQYATQAEVDAAASAGPMVGSDANVRNARAAQKGAITPDMLDAQAAAASGEAEGAASGASAGNAFRREFLAKTQATFAEAQTTAAEAGVGIGSSAGAAAGNGFAGTWRQGVTSAMAQSTGVAAAEGAEIGAAAGTAAGGGFQARMLAGMSSIAATGRAIMAETGTTMGLAAAAGGAAAFGGRVFELIKGLGWKALGAGIGFELGKAIAQPIAEWIDRSVNLGISDGIAGLAKKVLTQSQGQALASGVSYLANNPVTRFLGMSPQENARLASVSTKTLAQDNAQTDADQASGPMSIVANRNPAAPPASGSYGVEDGHKKHQKAAEDVIGPLRDQLALAEATTGQAKLQVEYHQKIAEIAKQLKVTYDAAEAVAGGLVKAIQEAQRAAAVRDFVNDNEKQIESVKAITPELKLQADIHQKIAEIEKEKGALSGQQKQTIAEQLTELQKVQSQIAFNEQMRSANAQLSTMQATTQAAKDYLAVVQEIAGVEKTSLLTDQQRLELAQQLLENKRLAEAQQLQDQLDPVSAARRKYADNSATIASMDGVSDSYRQQLQAQLDQSTAKARDPLGDWVKQQQQALPETVDKGLGKTAADKGDVAASAEAQKALNDLLKDGVQITPELTKAVNEYEAALAKLKKDQTTGLEGWANSIKPLKEQLEDLPKDFAQNLSGALEGALMGKRGSYRQAIQAMSGELVKTGVSSFMKNGLNLLGIQKPEQKDAQAAKDALGKVKGLSTQIQAASAVIHVGTATLNGKQLGADTKAANDNGIVKTASNDNALYPSAVSGVPGTGSTASSANATLQAMGVGGLSMSDLGMPPSALASTGNAATASTAQALGLGSLSLPGVGGGSTGSNASATSATTQALNQAGQSLNQIGKSAQTANYGADAVSTGLGVMNTSLNRTVPGLGQVAQGLESIISKAITSGGGVSSLLGFADGGKISGAGTSRSDSILARVSHGEFIVNAAATAQHEPLLHAINSGSLPGFADGGLVSSLGMAESSLSHGGGSVGAAAMAAIADRIGSSTASHSGTVQNTRNNTVNVNIQAKDADSFRRSRGQVAAAAHTNLARASSRHS